MVSVVQAAGNMGFVVKEHGTYVWHISERLSHTTATVERMTRNLGLRTVNASKPYNPSVARPYQYRNGYAPTLVAGNLGRGGAAKLAWAAGYCTVIQAGRTNGADNASAWNDKCQKSDWRREVDERG
jgi:hypothetical protein